ncbi:MAG: DUF4175 family protein [Lentisphaerae bacterium]|nr:DUF4175 family protein [Lentisphaerota bacterium]
MSQDTQTRLESVTWLQDGLKTARLRYYLVEKAILGILALSLFMFAFFAYGMADYAVRFPGIVRALITLGLGFGTAAFLRYFMRRAVRDLGDLESVARMVETVKDAESKSQRSRLICALQFGMRPEIPGSLQLKNEAIRRAREKSVSPAGAQLYDRKIVRLATRCGVAALLLYLGWFGLFLPSARTFLMRAMALNVRYPTATKILDVEWRPHAPVRIDYPVLVVARGRLPSAGKITVSYTGWRNFTVPLVPDEEGSSAYRAVIAKPTEPFTFKIRIGDCETGPYAVDVVNPPFINEATMEIQPPPYTGLQPATSGLKSLGAPEGSVVVIRARPDRPVRECSLLLATVGKKTSLPAQKDGEQYIASFNVAQSDRFALHLVDDKGIENGERVWYILTAVPDSPPQVSLLAPRSGTSRSNLSRLRLQVRATDDYRVDGARVAYKVYRPAGTDDESGDELVTEGQLTLPLTRDRLTVSAQLNTLVKEFGASEGDRITFTAIAVDNRPEAQEGLSDEVSVDIVSPDELRAIIGRDQKRAADLVKRLRDEEQRQAEAVQKRLNTS